MDSASPAGRSRGVTVAVEGFFAFVWFGWASTLSVTSYWAHPAALASSPPAELAWMVLSPADPGLERQDPG